MTIGIAGSPRLTQNYIEALRQNTAAEIEVSLQPDRAGRWDALLLPGGGDIDPLLLPGRPPLDPHCSRPEPCLDRQQLALLHRFVQQKKPVLGICKGMQLINLYFGGGLMQHLPTADAHRYLEYDQLHLSHAKSGSFLANLYGDSFLINSAHHQGILAGQTPLGEKIAAIQSSPDGVVEGIEHETLPVVGLQWHPERLCGRFSSPDAIDGSLIFQYFFRIRSAAS